MSNTVWDSLCLCLQTVVEMNRIERYRQKRSLQHRQAMWISHIMTVNCMVAMQKQYQYRKTNQTEAEWVLEFIASWQNLMGTQREQTRKKIRRNLHMRADRDRKICAARLLHTFLMKQYSQFVRRNSTGKPRFSGVQLWLKMLMVKQELLQSRF